MKDIVNDYLLVKLIFEIILQNVEKSFFENSIFEGVCGKALVLRGLKEYTVSQSCFTIIAS